MIQLCKLFLKKLATVQCLEQEFDFELHIDNKAQQSSKDRKKHEETKYEISSFCYHWDVVYIAPGSKDEMNVWTEAGKTKKVEVVTKHLLARTVCYI